LVYEFFSVRRRRETEKVVVLTIGQKNTTIKKIHKISEIIIIVARQ